ncbi:ABC transporter ATP-binding protein [Phaeacidiphilus oryzae]|uniref:ABC transporter ATP-binding protein n=1 Tax=Phaeacidiphilus oryzae TaxID=348818 RepID=UPI0009FFD344|nr:ABC transporter ATP-binding protein [Phaeacidiphilus oryzae]
MANSLPAIATEDLRVVRGGREVLRGLSFTVPRGTVTGLLGPSGCGKTTLIRCVVGTQITAGGTVTVLGRPAGSAALRGRIGYATQTPALYGDLTVVQNLRYFASLLRAPAADIDRVVEQTDLAAQRHQAVADLSGGQRARASLAAALLGSPELLVFDEPTVGLDPVLRNQLWELFRRLADEGATLLVSSHVMDEAGRCERLLLMREGRLLADDTPDGLRARTGTADLEQAFLRLIDEPQEAQEPQEPHAAQEAQDRKPREARR